MTNYKPTSVKELLKRQSNTSEYPLYGVVEKEVTLDGGAGSGAVGTVSIATITGAVEVSVIAVCSTNVAGVGSTLELGTTANTAGLIAQTTGTDIDAKEIWHDATPDATVELTSVVGKNIVSDDIILTVGTANATGGVIKFIIFWSPLSLNGSVVSA